MLYPRLFSPIRLGALELPNRVVQGSTHLGYEGRPDGMKRMAAYYAERARGEVGLIITGGAGVNEEGKPGVDALEVFKEGHVEYLAPLSSAVHAAGGRIALQLMHSGRYVRNNGYGLPPVSASPLRARINPIVPRAMTDEDCWRTVEDFGQAARRAKAAGFDAVEIMGSEGYLLDQFFNPYSNKRQDAWGDGPTGRMRLALEVTRRVRALVGPGFPIIFRMSGLDLVPGGSTFEEAKAFARALAAAGADCLNVGIGWHEADTPTINHLVPRGAFVWVASALRAEVDIPVMASNRINDPGHAEEILAGGHADLISMARPLLADPHLVKKAREGRADEINTCIACNQACLDRGFAGKEVSCMVNPAAGREREWAVTLASRPRRVAVVGAGPAGLEAARVLAARGHAVTLFEREHRLGGQFNLAAQVPGKQEFRETIRYFSTQLRLLGVRVEQGVAPEADDLCEYDEVAIATGAVPRIPDLPGVDLPHVATYTDVLSGRVTPGRRVAIVGAGGIGCDVAHFLTARGAVTPEAAVYLADQAVLSAAEAFALTRSGRAVTLMRRNGRPGEGIGATTRWALLRELDRLGVQIRTDLQYRAIIPDGVWIEREGREELVPADTVVLCTGQSPDRRLYEQIAGLHPAVHLIGGARSAGELDAVRAFYEGAELARQI